jgi:hypothetical protein
VHILQIGDSHTAGDRITGKLRAALQARFGDGGRGVLPPGVPYAGYAPLQVEVTAEGWTTTLAPLAGNAGYVRAGVGLTGVQAITIQPGSALTVRRETTSPALYRSACAGRPDASVTADDETGPWRSANAARSNTATAARAVQLHALDDVLSLHVCLTNNPGWSCQPRRRWGDDRISGAGPAVVARELATWRPA